MDKRLALHEELCDLIKSRNVYFQPPASVQMIYPCIKYSISGVDVKSANNRNYKSIKRYEIIVIDEDPDSTLPDLILSHFSTCRFDRMYTADNLNHSVLSLYY